MLIIEYLKNDYIVVQPIKIRTYNYITLITFPNGNSKS